MKKSIVVIALAAAVAASCTKTEVVKSDLGEGNVIGFSTYALSSKAYTSGDVDNAGATDYTNITAGHFGVVGYKADNNIYLGATDKAAEQEYGTTWEYSTASELRFWPAGNMDFYAYFPYSATAAFTSTNASGTVMTISSWTDGQDVLVASKLAQSYASRVALDFKHAFAKIKAVNVVTAGDVTSSGITVEIQSVEFLNTATAGKVLVAADGTISYDEGATPRKVTPASAVTASSTSAALIANTDNAYIFPASSLWDGVKSSITSSKTLATDSKVVMLLKAKVHQGDVYLVGTSSTYGDLYIPVADATTTAYAAAKRYTYNVTMKDNVGYDVNGDPILKPIKFSVNSVESWGDVTVTITL